MTHKLKFNISEASLGDVELDGRPLRVTEIHYHAKPNNIAVVTLTILAEVEGEIEFEKWSNVTPASGESGSIAQCLADRRTYHFKGPSA